LSLAVAAFEARFARLRAHRQRLTAAWGVGLAVTCIASAIVGDVNLRRLAGGLPNIIDFIARTLPAISLGSILHDIGEWFWAIDLWLMLLADTVLMAYVGTLAGVMLAVAGCFLAAEHLTPHPAWRFVARRAFELARTVPELVYALIFVYAFGTGPLAGVLALAIHTAGALGKLFAEAAENADLRPLDAVKAAGGGWSVGMRLAILPQVLPTFLSYALLRFEINVRSASVLGVVGAGGIGEELYLVVRQFIYSDISAIVLLILATVSLIDIATGHLRARLIGAGLAR
jgi:phosphonate transport system permease protein